MRADVGSLLYITDPNSGKRRPHICVCVFKNKAGVKYDWLVLPITSSSIVGDENLIKVEHPRLRIPSFAKLNNIKTITAAADVEIANEEFDEVYVKQIADKLQFLFKG